MNAPSVMFGVVMHEMLPICYDASVLEAIGGTFCMRISGVGEYTLAVVSRRIVTLAGLPVDAKTQAKIIDLEIAPDVMLAFCRGLLLDIADDVLSEDEFEDREVSGAELLFNGMPSGGYLSNERSRDYASTLADATNGNAGALNVNSVVGGTISINDVDYFAIALNAGVTYTITMRGQLSGRGSLSAPAIQAIHSSRQAVLTGTVVAISDVSRNYTPTASGIYYIAVGSAKSYQGTYQLSVEEAGNVMPLLPSVEASGSDFASNLSGARANAIGGVTVNGSAQGFLSYGDRDWYAVTLDAGQTYWIDLRGVTMTDMVLYGVRDRSGTLVANVNDNIGGEAA